jgi:hypothetical protein
MYGIAVAPTQGVSAVRPTQPTSTEATAQPQRFQAGRTAGVTGCGREKVGTLSIA